MPWRDLHKTPLEAPEKSGASVLWAAVLWPNRSLPNVGFAWTIGIAAGLLSLPLLTLVGTAAMWGLLPFLMIPVIGLWIAIRRNDADGQMTEELTLTPARLHLCRTEPDGTVREWEANPYHVRIDTHEGPVENYLTLRGGNRVVELGAFLAPEERLDLKTRLEDELRHALSARFL